MTMGLSGPIRRRTSVSSQPSGSSSFCAAMAPCIEKYTPSTPPAAASRMEAISSADSRVQPSADRMPADPARAPMASTGSMPTSRKTSKAPPRPVFRWSWARICSPCSMWKFS